MNNATKTQDALIALAVRCETEEPSWDLSVDIELALQPGSTYSALEGFTVYAEGKHYNPPAYTTSLDAAVTLVPSREIWSVHGCDAPGHKAFADVSTTWEPHYFKGDAKTPALALCAAALRARVEIGR